MSAHAVELADAGPTVDERNPWIGLASFTEETRDYFYGREEEVAELARRVQRKLLTVLFGQSGLGKTSILRAGLVPRLRQQGYCPVYLRVDYSREAPEPSVQIKQAIALTARRLGQWTQAGVAAADETLWEFLHHRDDVLRDESGRTLIPLLIFDQFEEMFTLAQADEFGRARAARFIADLADLVENRPPVSLEAKLDADDTTAERFDFARSDYRVLIALREDYLAPLESLKTVMPSVTQNRLRLARMNGTQGLAAVLSPGKGLVTQEVASAIVRFIAGGAELANAEVEPSLLSLICRELNDTRIAQGRAEISLDLLAGSHAEILSSFYERALADQPAAVRRIIEDELLTDSGFRENIAEERLQRSFAQAGASLETLSTLVNRRLLRIEERLDVRRVELTHDVLCTVVKSSRDVRHERQARETTERLLAEQKQRERAARSEVIRARQIATACIVLALGAVAAATYAYWSTQRARRAEALAQQSRVQAEQLLDYLTADFARELEGSSLETIAKLAQREVDYFHALPPELKGPSTRRTGAIALYQLAKASRRLGRLGIASAAIAESEQLLEGLRKSDDSEATVVALARTLSQQSSVLRSKGLDDDATRTAQRAADLLNPLVSAPSASVTVREAAVEALIALGVALHWVNESDKAIEPLEYALQIASQLGAREIDDISMAYRYIEAGAWLIQALIVGGDADAVRRVSADVAEVADKVLATRPGDRNALFNLGLIHSALADLALDEMRPEEALAAALPGEAALSTLVALDPSNRISLNNLAGVQIALSNAHWALGRFAEATHYGERAQEMLVRAGVDLPNVLLNRLRLSVDLGYQYAELSRFEAAEALLQQMARGAAALRGVESGGSGLSIIADATIAAVEGRIALVRGDADAALRIAQKSLVSLDTEQARSGTIGFLESMHALSDIKARADFMLGDYAASEQSARMALEARKQLQVAKNFDLSSQADQSTQIALALVAQQRAAEALTLLEPVVKLRRDLAARNHGDQQVPVGLASALYVQALIDAQRRTELLRESAALLDSLSPEYKQLYSVSLWRNRVREAMRADVRPLGGGES